MRPAQGEPGCICATGTGPECALVAVRRVKLYGKMVPFEFSEATRSRIKRHAESRLTIYEAEPLLRYQNNKRAVNTTFDNTNPQKKQKQQKEKGATKDATKDASCFICGADGHKSWHCPLKRAHSGRGMCWRCGGQHSLRDCPVEVGQAGEEGA